MLKKRKKAGDFVESSRKRIEKDIEYIGNITATPGNGCTRFSYTEEDRKVRDYLLNIFKDLDLDVSIDAVGNIRAKYKGEEELPSIMIGSHIDTVKNGGKFDGVVGVITALETLRVIKEKNIKIKRPIELIIFAEEEGSNFGVTMLGSKYLIGYLKKEDLKEIKNDQEVSAYDMIKNFDLRIEEEDQKIISKSEVECMIETHVEQGGILDTENIPVGIVDAIAGMKTCKVLIKGTSNHAGSTPMDLRQDPMTGAAEIILGIEKLAKEEALDTTVGTVGKIFSKPNSTNVIPEQIEFYIDTRDVKPDGLDFMIKEIKKLIEKVCKKRKLESEFKVIGKNESVVLSEEIKGTIEKVAKEKDYKYKKINSGAVHDAAMLAEILDVGMIFVPSIKGKSHCPQELTKYEDIKQGCDLLIDSVVELCNK